MEERLHISTEQFPRLSYLKTGKGPVMVLLHGFPENSGLWRKVWPELSDSFTVIVPDLPGSGESTFKDGDFTMEQMAESIQMILENEKVGQAIVVGHSMGGYTALAFADKYGDKLKGLSLVHSTAAADTEDKKETRRKAIELLRKGGKDAFIKQMIPGMFSDAFKKEHPEMIKEEIERGMALDTDSLVAFYNAMIKRPDRTGILSKADFPVQWIIGREDNVVPADKVLQQSRLANVNFVSVYADCAHMSMLEKSHKLAHDLDEFGKYCYRKKYQA